MNLIPRRRPAPDHDPAPENPDTAAAVDGMADWVASANQLSEILAENTAEAVANPDTAAHLRARSAETSLAQIDADARERTARLDAVGRRREAIAERERRAVAEALADADEATADLKVTREWEREASPVTAARRLGASARWWRRADLGYALAGSALSAVGIAAALNTATPLPLAGAAAVAAAMETVMTVRVVDLIGRVARLDELNRSEKADSGQDNGNSRTHLIVQAGAVLAVSVLINILGIALGAGWLGAVGVAGALLAAASGLGSHASTRAATDVVSANLTAWRGEAWEESRAELRRRASGHYIPDLGYAEPAPGGHYAEEAEPAEAAPEKITPEGMSPRDKAIAAHMIAADPEIRAEVLEAIAAQALADEPVPDDPRDLEGDDAPQDSPSAPRNAGGDQGATTGGNDGATSTDTDPAEGGDDGPPSHLTDAARRRSAEAEQRVAAYYADHPGAPVKRAARDLGVAPETVRKYRPDNGAGQG